MEILFLLVLIFGGFVLFTLIDWSTHISMVKNDNAKYGWAGYKEFKREFKKVESELVFDRSWKNSLFSELRLHRKHYLHANIIIFNYNGMIIHNPISYFLVKVYIRKFISKNFQHEKNKDKKNVIKWID